MDFLTQSTLALREYSVTQRWVSQDSAGWRTIEALVSGDLNRKIDGR
jgi:hypothetical protein